MADFTGVSGAQAASTRWLPAQNAGSVQGRARIGYNRKMLNSSAAEGRWVSTFDSPTFASRATEDDIFYCYRLLLGRNPDRRGFETYAGALQSQQLTVTDLLQIFLSSPEFNSRALLRGEGRSFTLVELAGFRMYASPEDWAVGKHIVELGAYEPHVTLAMKRLLRRGMTFLDIGANIGYFTLLARSVVGPEGKVLAFEPNPRNCALLDLSLALNGFQDVEIYPFALADSSRLFVYDSQASNGSLSPFDGRIDTLSSRTVVRTATLDQILHLSRCDVLKIDIEGAEWMAIRGAMRTIREHRPAIFSEYCPGGLRNVSRVEGEDYLRLLFDEGYRVAVITPYGDLADCGQSAAAVTQAYEQSKASHLDILATQPPHGGL